MKQSNKFKRIAAIIAIVMLLSLYLVTFIMAFFVTKNSMNMFKTCVIATIMIPILLYVIMFIYRLIHPEDEGDGKNGGTGRDGEADRTKEKTSS